MSSTGNARLRMLEKLARTSGDHVIQGITDASSPYRTSLLASLEDFLATIEKLEMAGGRSALATSIVRSNYGDVLDAFAVFASSIWTNDEVSRFEAHGWGARPRPQKVLFLVSLRDAQATGNTPLQEVAFHIFRVLDKVLVDIQSDTYADSNTVVKPEKKGQRSGNPKSKWPSSPSELVPHGAEKAVSGCINWAKLMDNIAPLDVLSQLTGYYPSFISIIIKEEAVWPLIKNLFLLDPSLFGGLGPRNQNEPRYALVEQQLVHFSSIFRAYWLLIQLQSQDATFAKDNIQTLTPLYNAVCDVIPLIDTPALNLTAVGRVGITSSFIDLATQILECSLLTDAPLPKHPHLQDPNPEPTNPDHGLHFMEFLCGVANFRDQKECTELSCLRTGEETGSSLMRCNGCKVARYCSKECQKSDWGAHKLVCKSLKALQETYDRRYSLGVKEVDMIMMDPSRLATYEKLKESSGLNESEIRSAKGYLEQRAVTMRVSANRKRANVRVQSVE